MKFPKASSSPDTCKVFTKKKKCQGVVHGAAQCNPFQDNTLSLYDLMTKHVVPETMEKDMLTMEEGEQQSVRSFVEQRICGPTNMWKRMPNVKFLTWNDTC